MFINRLVQITILSFSFVFPLFFLPLTGDLYEINKFALLLVVALFLLCLSTIKIARDKKITIYHTSFGLFLFLLSLITIISTIFQSPNLVATLTTPLSTATIISLAILYFLISYNYSPILKEGIIFILLFDSLLVSIYILLMYLGILPQQLATPMGNLLGTALFLTIVFIYLLTSMIQLVLSHPLVVILKKPLTFLFGISLIVIFLADLILTIHLFTDQKPIILPFSFGWMILLEIIKPFQTLSLGIGPTNFITAFTLAKPYSFNQTIFWNLNFTSSSSFFLNLVSETGIFAGFIFLLIFIRSIKLIFSSKEENSVSHLSLFNQFSAKIALVISLLLSFTLPINMSVIILIVILMVLAGRNNKIKEINLAKLKKTSYLLPLSTLFICLVIGYFIVRAYLAEIMFKNSLDAMTQGNGTEAYNFQRSAIALNPYLDRYHLAFSQTSLSIANALVADQNLTEEKKQQIPPLTQQAINEAKSATLLNRTNIMNWDNLARIYASLVNFAQGADKWAVDSYQRQLVLDPVNPSIRVNFGGLYLSLQDYTQAENQFRQAIRLKSDYANGYYNLAISLRHQKRYQEAYQALQTLTQFLPPDSTELDKVRKEISLLPKEITNQQATPSSLPTSLPTISLAQPPSL